MKRTNESADFLFFLGCAAKGEIGSPFQAARGMRLGKILFSCCVVTVQRPTFLRPQSSEFFAAVFLLKLMMSKDATRDPIFWEKKLLT